MTRSDYFLIAKAITNVFEHRSVAKKETLVRTLVAMMREDNPNFQEFRFLAACGMSELYPLSKGA